MVKKKVNIAITGTMGSGKTTAAKLISKYFKFHLLEENYGENAFLSRFYKNMKRWAFHSQTFFLMEKISQMLATKKIVIKNSVVQDTPIYQDVFSYAKAQNILGNMDDAEWRLYQKIYRSFLPHLPKPNFIVYIKTSVKIVNARISKRARKFEQKIPAGYLELLEMLNEKWMKKESNGAKIITIDSEKLNLIRNKKDKHAFLSKVEKGLK